MSGGLGERRPTCSTASSTRGARGSTPIKINAVVAARRERSHGARPGRALPRHRRHRALHRIHGRRQPQPLESRARRAVAASCSTRIGARWPLTPCEQNYRGEVAERYAFEDGAGEVGFISSVTQPFCGDCSRARLSSDGVFYTCLFATQGTGPARAAARRRERRRAALDSSRDVWTRPRRPLQRAARVAAAPASNRCARSRCTTSAANAWLLASLTSIPPRPPDDGRRRRQGRHAAHGHCGGARALPARGRAQRCARSGHRTKKGPVFDTAIVAGVMAAKRTHELIPFCHPLPLENCSSTSTCDGDDAHRHRCTRVRAPQDRRRDGSADRRERRRAHDLRHVQGAVARHRDRRACGSREDAAASAISVAARAS